MCKFALLLSPLRYTVTCTYPVLPFESSSHSNCMHNFRSQFSRIVVKWWPYQNSPTRYDVDQLNCHCLLTGSYSQRTNHSKHLRKLVNQHSAVIIHFIELMSTSDVDLPSLLYPWLILKQYIAKYCENHILCDGSYFDCISVKLDVLILWCVSFGLPDCTLHTTDCKVLLTWTAPLKALSLAMEWCWESPSLLRIWLLTLSLSSDVLHLHNST